MISDIVDLLHGERWPVELRSNQPPFELIVKEQLFNREIRGVLSDVNGASQTTDPISIDTARSERAKAIVAPCSRGCNASAKRAGT